ncbi:hypothetical protein [Nisaea sediminum]|uniref:hypothetical protein n=1 Tax=Nisaea sediminum TaxID=2775867 RepID=UPI001866F8F6|nr:hypothetical protein [Nisaea sediminum]
MPVFNPVNDASNAVAAGLNCAFCTLCGVVDTGNCSSWIKILLDKFPDHRAPPLDCDEIFGAYWEGLKRLPRASKGRETLDHQVKGLHFVLGRINPRGRRATVDITGSSDDPLTLDEATSLMEDYPIGTRFAYLIGRWTTALGRGQINAAHWLTAERVEEGLKFIDYQMDVIEDIRPRVGRREEVLTKCLQAPHITDGPMRPFGKPPDFEKDKALFISYVVADIVED